MNDRFRRIEITTTYNWPRIFLAAITVCAVIALVVFVFEKRRQ